MKIKLGEVGKIVSGQELGRYVKVVDDAANTGGYFIITAASPSMRDAFDNWVESGAVLQRFFEEAEWVVEWLH